MRVQCAWCQRWFPDKPPFESEEVSHTICPPCVKKIGVSMMKAKKNPGAAWHRKKAADAHTMDAQAQRKGKKMLSDFFHGKEVAHTESELAASAMKMNPLAVFTVGNPGRPHGKFRSCVKQVKKSLKKYRRTGSPEAICGAALNENPPDHISANIQGIIYHRCLEIRAEKTGWKPGLYRHPFSRRSGVQVLALDNGDILIHSAHGKRLWKRATS